MAKLTEQQKVFVVQRLACFYTPTDVRDELKQEHGVDVSLSAVMYYDPSTAEGMRLAPALKELFEVTRQRFIENAQAVPIANQSYRLRELQGLYQRSKKNPVLAADLLEQAAKEVGGMFTNRREVTGANGGPVQVEQKTDLSGLSTDELYELRRLREKIGQPTQPPRN